MCEGMKERMGGEDWVMSVNGIGRGKRDSI